jgi:hypothetical protein
MNILAAVKREEIKLEKQLGKLNHKSSGVRAAAKALGRSAERDVIGVKKRVLSAAGRGAIAKAAKKRWGFDGDAVVAMKQLEVATQSRRPN